MIANLIEVPTLKHEYKVARAVIEAAELGEDHGMGDPQLLNGGTKKEALVMDLRGPSLNDVLEDHTKLKPAQACLIMALVLHRLEIFHRSGYVHADLKPENIVFDNSSNKKEQMKNLYIIDFGISTDYLDANGDHVK